ncbi:MAG: flagellum-specific ATP synthase FliI, partial [Bdellovibrionales bacterium CG22_combo_CG10-13_8_21_14_all_38_13]
MIKDMKLSSIDFDKYQRALERRVLVRDIGKVTDVIGLMIEAYLPGAKLGSLCEITSPGRPSILTEVIG